MAQLRITVGTRRPDVNNALTQLRVTLTAAQPCAQIGAFRGEQAGVEFAIRRETQTAAFMTKRLRH